MACLTFLTISTSISWLCLGFGSKNMLWVSWLFLRWLWNRSSALRYSNCYTILYKQEIVFMGNVHKIGYPMSWLRSNVVHREAKINNFKTLGKKNRVKVVYKNSWLFFFWCDILPGSDKRNSLGLIMLRNNWLRNILITCKLREYVYDSGELWSDDEQKFLFLLSLSLCPFLSLSPPIFPLLSSSIPLSLCSE